MNRMQSFASAAIGPSFFTPTWADFRNQAKGYDADMGSTPFPRGSGPATLNRMAVDDNGTMECEPLESCDSGWLDLGGAPGTLVASRRI